MSEPVTYYHWNEDRSLTINCLFPNCYNGYGPFYAETEAIDLATHATDYDDEYYSSMEFSFSVALRWNEYEDASIRVECSPRIKRASVPESATDAGNNALHPLISRLAVVPKLSFVGFEETIRTILSAEESEALILEPNQWPRAPLLRGSTDMDGCDRSLTVLRLDLSFPYYQTPNGQKQSTKTGCSSSYSKEMVSQAAKLTNADFVLVTSDGTKHLTHRFVLRARSPVFEAMLTHDTKENKEGVCPIDDLDSATVEALLKFLHSLDISGLADHAEKLLHAASKYQISDLESTCVQELGKNATAQNSAHLLILADQYGLKVLKEIVLARLKTFVPEFIAGGGTESVRAYSEALFTEVIEAIRSVVTVPATEQRKRKRT